MHENFPFKSWQIIFWVNMHIRACYVGSLLLKNLKKDYNLEGDIVHHAVRVTNGNENC